MPTTRQGAHRKDRRACVERRQRCSRPRVCICFLCSNPFGSESRSSQEKQGAGDLEPERQGEGDLVQA